MASSLYDISVRCYLQTVGAMSHILHQGLTHCKSAGTDPDQIVEIRLFTDMLPFRFQVQSVMHHSLGAVQALRSGGFAPPHDLKDDDYETLVHAMAETHAALEKIDAAEIDALAGRDVTFAARGFERHFTAEGFVLSFSLPNLHFHAATAYDILRLQGVPLGKRDFMGQMQTKG
jgi:hypothetical protein